MGPIQSFAEFFDMLRRRAWLLLVLTALGTGWSVLFALSLPHVFASSEVIQIESPRITDNLAQTTVNGSSARRMQLIEQQLMARDAILATIGKLGLFDDLPDLTTAEKVDLFRKSVSIEGVAAAREGGTDDGTISILRISAQFGSPEKAQAVAHELAARTLQLSASARRDQTRATLEFFVSEETVLTDAIVDLEKEIAAYREQNDIAMTGTLGLRQVELTSMNDAISDLERSMITVQRELDAIDTQSQRSATVRRVKELDQQLATLREQRAYFDQRAQDLQNALSNSAEVERRTRIFERRLNQYQDQLDEISARRSEAEIGNRLEMNRQAERLEILEAASLPDDPVAPSRRKIALAGVISSVFGALVIAFLLDLRHPVLRFSAQMEREMGFLPAVSIPTLKPVKSQVGRWPFRGLARLWSGKGGKRLEKPQDRLPV